MPSAPRSLLIAIVTACSLALLAPALATARAQSGHIDLRDGLTLAQQFGYAPEYRQNTVTFDAHNAPAIRSRGASQDDTSFVHRLEGGSWVRHSFVDALRAAHPEYVSAVNGGGWASDRVDFDTQGRAYSVLTIRLRDRSIHSVLLYSTDGCDTWKVCELPYGDETPQYGEDDWGSVASEHDSGRLLEGPPLLALWRQTAPWRGAWSSVNELYVVQPVWSGDQLTLQAPVLVSRVYLGAVQCAGGSSFAVTSGNQSYFVYTTIVPRRTRITPVYAATYDRTSNTVGPSTRVAISRPANDTHCTPAICMDSAGILHVVSGAHGSSFYYSRSRQPRSTSAWTAQRPLLSSGYRGKLTDADGYASQTYLSLVRGPDDVLHVVCRQQRRNIDAHFRGRDYGALIHQSRRPGQTWSSPHLIVVPPQPGYSQFYQKLTVDRLGRLYVSCSYFSRREPLVTSRDRRFHHRMVLISKDGGLTWRFATAADFLAGMAAMK